MEEWHYKQINALKQIIKPDWIYIDIGASVGEMLEFFLNTMSKGYAFEPDPDNYNHLKKQIDNLNIPIDQLELINKAVSDNNVPAKFWRNGTHMGNLLGHDTSYRPYDQNNYITVECETLDNFLINKTVDLIKMDVEGMEWNIFQGAQHTLATKNIIYQAELHILDKWHNREILYNYDYDIYDLDFNLVSRDSNDQPYQCLIIKNTDNRFNNILKK